MITHYPVSFSNMSKSLVFDVDDPEIIVNCNICIICHESGTTYDPIAGTINPTRLQNV
jgi:nitrate reductase cytochrome c-type subunit